MENETKVVGPDVQAEAAPKQPELSVNDLQQLRAVVEVATRRGAFQAAELSAVGQVYDRVNAFLNAVAPPKQEPEVNAQETEKAS
jgi:hypothetical protein